MPQWAHASVSMNAIRVPFLTDRFLDATLLRVDVRTMAVVFFRGFQECGKEGNKEVSRVPGL